MLPIEGDDSIGGLKARVDMLDAWVLVSFFEVDCDEKRDWDNSIPSPEALRPGFTNE